MFEILLSIAAGLTLLVIGGEFLLRGAISISRLLQLSPAIVGLTVVAAATSVPELAVSLAAALRGSSDIAVGNVVGSNISNIGLILGLSALFRPLIIQGQTIKLEYPFLFLVTYLLFVVARDGNISGYEGSLFLLVFVMFTVYMVALVRKQMTSGEEVTIERELKERSAGVSSVFQPGLLVLCGIGLLWGGAELTVHGAILGAKIFGVSDRIIGLTVVAVGTSLPELVASLVSAYRGRGDIAVGNIVGSNIFNILVILGCTALIRPISVHPAVIQWDNWWMLGLTLVLFPLMVSQLSIARREGAFLTAAYFSYIILLVVS